MTHFCRGGGACKATMSYPTDIGGTLCCNFRTDTVTGIKKLLRIYVNNRIIEAVQGNARRINSMNNAAKAHIILSTARTFTFPATDGDRQIR